MYFKRINSGPGIQLSETDEIITFSVNSSLLIKDPSIEELYQFYYSLENTVQDLSIYIDSKFINIDTSISDIYNYIDGSISYLQNQIDILDDSVLKNVINIGSESGLFKQIFGNTAELRSIVGGGCQYWDSAEFHIAPDTIIGVLTQDYIPGDSSLYVSDTVLENISLGFHITIDDSSCFGRVIEKDPINKVIKIET